MATLAQYKLVTGEIIAALEAGTVPWQKPWSQPSGISGDHNGATGHAYRGMNPITLWAVSARRGFTSNVWLTLKQAGKLGGHIKKGAKQTYVYYWDFPKREQVNPDTGKTEIVTFPIIKIYGVFNLEDTVNVKLPKRETIEPEALNEWDPIVDAQAVVDHYIAKENGLSLNHKAGDRACYDTARDIITMPEPAQFTNPAEYYSTVYHEMGHSTGHTSRLRRFAERAMVLAPFGSEDYSKEELVAEFTSAFLCYQVGISSTRDNSVAYIKNWLRVLRDDPKMALAAASKAQKASDYIIATA